VQFSKHAQTFDPGEEMRPDHKSEKGSIGGYIVSKSRNTLGAVLVTKFMIFMVRGCGFLYFQTSLSTYFQTIIFSFSPLILDFIC